MSQLTTTQFDFEKYALDYTMEGPIAPERKYLMNKISIEPDMKLLDVGCGDGRHLEFLQNRIGRKNLYGTEISQIRVDRVREKGFQCEKVDGVRLPFPDSMFDVIVVFEVIEHIPPKEVDLMMREFKRVLKPEGVVIGTTPNYPVKLWYHFIYRIFGRLRQLFFKKSVQEREKLLHEGQAPSFREKEIVRRWSLPWIKKQFKRMIADDPTHQFFCNFNIVRAIGQKHFTATELYATLIRTMKISLLNPIHFFSDSISFIFKN